MRRFPRLVIKTRGYNTSTAVNNTTNIVVLSMGLLKSPDYI